MPQIRDNSTRDQVLRFISRSVNYGNLGVFIGAGLSKAVLNDDTAYVALSWGELLEKAAQRLGVDYNRIGKDGASYPEIASAICKNHSSHNRISYTSALSELKRAIAGITAWYPDARRRNQYYKYLTALSPAWVITTNYDLVVESILTGVSVALGPNDSLSAPKDIVPVYHLHAFVLILKTLS
jgi:hypothetical protein